MNTLCRDVLQGYRSENDDKALQELIDAILNYKGEVADISENDLKQANGIEVVNGEDNVPQIHDYRIKSLAFKNFRTFPERSDKPYGLLFTDTDGEPSSVFLVGKNGTGKSTVFDALEMIYAGKVRNAEERGVREKDKLNEYLTYGFREIDHIPTGNVMLGIRLNDDKILKKGWLGLEEIPALCVAALCCSDMDIEEISQLDEEVKLNVTKYQQEGENGVRPMAESAFQRYIRSQLGYQDLTILRDRIMKLVEEFAMRGLDVERRMKLAELTSADLRAVQEAFTSMIENSKQNWDQKKEETERFVAKKEIEAFKDIEILDIKVEEMLFPEVWNSLVQNISNLRQQQQTRTGDSGYIDEKETQENPQNKLGDVIDERISILHALYVRLNQACETYQEKGLSTAFVELEKDYSYLVNNKNKLPIHHRELNALQIWTRTEMGAMAKLINKLNTTMSNLFKERDEGGKKREGFPEDLNKFVERILNHYKEKDTEVFKVSSTANSFEVKVHVTDKEGNYFETVPRKYLNTFRFRLYAVLLKIALSLYYMKSNQCVAPIVIDDVFNASDFENSLSLRTFVFSIIEIYQEVIGGEVPLQLIILTHDEMIANAFSEGVKMKSPRMKQREDDKMPRQEDYCIFGRLFSYVDAEELEKEIAKDGKDDGIASLKLDFLNLYLPTKR